MVKEIDMELDFDTAVDKLLDAAATDFAQWKARGEYGSANDFEDFRENIYRDGGRKYLRITKSQGGQQMRLGFRRVSRRSKVQVW
jgi:hypothetical protein